MPPKDLPPNVPARALDVPAPASADPVTGEPDAAIAADPIEQALRLLASPEVEQARRRLASPPANAKVVVMRFGGEEMPGGDLEERGQAFQITEARIREIEAKAHARLHARAADHSGCGEALDGDD